MAHIPADTPRAGNEDEGSKIAAHLQQTQGSADDAARQFLKTHGEVWEAWVAPDVAARVKAAL